MKLCYVLNPLFCFSYVHSPFPRGRFHLNKPLCSSVRRNTFWLKFHHRWQKFSHVFRLHFQFYLSCRDSSTEVLNPSCHPWGLGLTLSKVLLVLSIDLFSWITNVLSSIWKGRSFLEGFLFALSTPMRGIMVNGSYNLAKVIT